MKQNNLFRAALATSIYAPDTIDKYILMFCKLELLEQGSSTLNLLDMMSTIKAKYELEFSESDIRHAIISEDNGWIKSKDNSLIYSLKPQYMKTFRDELNERAILDDFIKEFHNKFLIGENVSFTFLKELISRYIYEVFNSGKETMISLLSDGKSHFDVANEKFAAKDKNIINRFLEWDNNDKNACIFNIISYCIDYGMINSGRGLEETKGYFENIVFYLDTNIIFRMIGINNKERQAVTNHFVEKSQKVGISLCYTNFTKEEIDITLDYIIESINKINCGDQLLPPFELEQLGDYENSDFYEIYYNWACNEENNYDDIVGFREYILGEVEICLSNFKRIDILNYEVTEHSKLLYSLSQKLMHYKNTRKREGDRQTSKKSAIRDINNYLHVKLENDIQSNSKSYFITADRGFHDWSLSAYPGVSLVFRPSEWLSIILKFTSRTENDYSTFCKFINLRISNFETKSDVMYAINKMNDTTSDVEIKKRIIKEINKNRTHNETISPQIIDKAMDSVLDEIEREIKAKGNKKIEAKLKDLEIQNSIKFQGRIASYKTNTMQKAVEYLVNHNVDKKLRVWSWLDENMKIFETLIILVSFLVLFLICNVTILEQFVNWFCSTSVILVGNEFEIAFLLSGIVSSIIGVIFYFIVKNKTSDKRKSRLIQKEMDQYNEVNVDIALE